MSFRMPRSSGRGMRNLHIAEVSATIEVHAGGAQASSRRRGTRDDSLMYGGVSDAGAAASSGACADDLNRATSGARDLSVRMMLCVSERIGPSAPPLTRLRMTSGRASVSGRPPEAPASRTAWPAARSSATAEGSAVPEVTTPRGCHGQTCLPVLRPGVSVPRGSTAKLCLTVAPIRHGTHATAHLAAAHLAAESATGRMDGSGPARTLSISKRKAQWQN